MSDIGTCTESSGGWIVAMKLVESVLCLGQLSFRFDVGLQYEGQ